jgi:hypothetical protein
MHAGAPDWHRTTAASWPFQATLNWSVCTTTKALLAANDQNAFSVSKIRKQPVSEQRGTPF